MSERLLTCPSPRPRERGGATEGFGQGGICCVVEKERDEEGDVEKWESSEEEGPTSGSERTELMDPASTQASGVCEGSR